MPQNVEVYVADLNKDGHPDLIVKGDSDIVFVALGNGDGSFSASRQISAGSPSNRLMFATVQGAANSIATYDFPNGEYLTLLLNQASLTTSLSASQTSVTTGDDVTLTATVAATVAGSPAPSGTVNFLEGIKVLGSANLIGGTAIYSFGGFTAGSHVYTAQYSGDANYAATPIAGVTVSVTAPVSTPLTPTVTVTSSAATITNQQGATVRVAASGAAGAAVPTGSVTLASGNSYIVVQSLA